MAGALKVVVTGASSGIGRATAIGRARRGHLVFAEDRRPRPRYVVPASARPLITLLTSLPDRLADRAEQRALGAS
jgi:NAD(P)-dependent dehydrogenase (short-subunit alcohol dehydrogenase family)